MRVTDWNYVSSLVNYYWKVVALKRSEIVIYAVASILLVGLLTVPYRHFEQRTSSYEVAPQQWNNVSIVLGGPMITLVTVELNRTARIQFMYPEGVWPRNALLASFTGTGARYNYHGEHYTIAIEVASHAPILIRVEYLYTIETTSCFLDSPLAWLGPFVLP